MTTVSTGTDVAIVLPMHEQVALTELAVDALRRLTADVVVRIVVVDTCSRPATRDRVRALGVDLLELDEAPWTWWQDPVQVASLANGRALAAAAAQIDPAWRRRGLFVMHTDCVPLHPRWLAHLCDQLDPAGGVAGATYKTDAIRIQAMHCSGFLVASPVLERLTPAMWLPDARRDWDAGDGVTAAIRGLGLTYAVNPWHTHRPRPKPGKVPLPCATRACEVRADAWYADENCDVSTFRSGEPAWLHKGGGSGMSARAVERWVAVARKGLGL